MTCGILKKGSSKEIKMAEDEKSGRKGPEPRPQGQQDKDHPRVERKSHDEINKSISPSNQAPAPWPQPWDNDSDED